MSYELTVSVYDRQNIKDLRDSYANLMKDFLAGSSLLDLKELKQTFRDLLYNIALYHNEITRIQTSTADIYYYYGRRFVELEQSEFNKFNYVGLISFRDTVLRENVKQELDGLVSSLDDELLKEDVKLRYFYNKMSNIISDLSSSLNWFVRDFRKTSGGSVLRLLLNMQKFFDIKPDHKVSEFKKIIAHYEPKLKKDRSIIYHYIKRIYKTIFGADLSVLKEIKKKEMKEKVFYVLQNNPDFLDRLFKLNYFYGMVYDQLGALQMLFYINLNPLLMFYYLHKKGFLYDFNKTLLENFIECLSQELGVYPNAIKLVKLSKLQKSDFPFKDSKKHAFEVITNPYLYGFIVSQYVSKFDIEDNATEFQINYNKNILLWLRPSGYYFNYARNLNVRIYPFMISGHKQNVVTEELKEKFAKLRRGEYDVDFSDEDEYLKLLEEKAYDKAYRKEKIYTTQPIKYLVEQEIIMRREGRFVFALTSNLRQKDYDLFFHRLTILREKRRRKGALYVALKRKIMFVRNKDGTISIQLKAKRKEGDIMSLSGSMAQYLNRLPERARDMLYSKTIGETITYFMDEFKRYYRVISPSLIDFIIKSVYNEADKIDAVLPHLIQPFIQAHLKQKEVKL